jgi:type I restriction enzyme S subunit
VSVPAYPAYQETGVQWLQAIPTSWRTVPFWSLFRRTKRVGHGDEELLSVYRDYGVIRKADRDDNFNNPSEDLSTYQLVEPGDLAMNKMKAWQGSLGISSHRGIVSPAYFVYQPQSQEHPGFLHYLLRSPPYAAGYMTVSKGIRINQWDIDPDYLDQIPVCLPSLAEQAAIAAFLDRETGKIDALVEEQRRLIALLKEKRQAVISHAVTKGLNPQAPLKPSGIEWLGDISAHWEVVPLKRLWSVTDCKHLTAEFVPEGVPLASIKEVQSRFVDLSDAKRTTEYFYVQLIDGDRLPLPGDLIFSRNATVGEVAQVAEWHPPFAMGQDVCLLHKRDAATSTDFFQAVLKSRVVVEQLQQVVIGATFKRVNVEDIRNLMVPFPPPDEQALIARVVIDSSGRFDALVGQAEAAATLLHERRAALISAAVTGKIDVRGLVATPGALEAA